MRVVETLQYREKRDAISHDWIKMLESLSISVMLIPNVMKDPVSYMRDINVRGLILTGGNDLGLLPEKLGGNDISEDRDHAEIELLNSAIHDSLPVFGVCRGLQLVNHFFGGNTVHDLGPSGQHVNVCHPLEILFQPFHKIKYNKKVVTNSYHKQGVHISGLAPDMKAFAVASNDIVEGIKHNSLPIMAIQWHPERQNPASELDRILLEGWLAQCE